MRTPVSTFDQHLDQWKRGQSEPWMRLRYELAHTYLQRHLPPPPARILDIGGGNGYDALPLAQAGYQVTILDYSAAMLADAQSQIQALGLGDRMALIQGDLDSLAAHVPEASADVIFCHNIFQYVASPAPYLAAIAGRLAPGGMLSIISPNPAAEALRVAFQEYDLLKARGALGATEQYTPTFGVMVQRYTAEQLAQWLASVGLPVVIQYGIRCVCDYLSDNARKYNPAFYAELRALELLMGTREPYMQIARFIHLIAQKPFYDSDR